MLYCNNDGRRLDLSYLYPGIPLLYTLKGVRRLCCYHVSDVPQSLYCLINWNGRDKVQAIRINQMWSRVPNISFCWLI